MKSVYWIIISVLLFSGCSRYPGYKKLTPEIYYSLFQFGNPVRKPLPGDYITVLLEYRTRKDSLFFTGLRKVRISEPSDNASIDHCFLKLSMDDSASFILPALKFFNNTLKQDLPEFIRSDETIKINVRLLSIQSEQEFTIEKQLFLKWCEDLSEQEDRLLQRFIKEGNPGITLKPEGFFMLTIKPGNNRKVVKGDHVWVNYEGKFLNGKFFDGTYRSREPVDFIYGTQFILISGLEQALSYMSEGEKAMIILPSDLAFGERGDEFGIIPPYTSLVYTLELVKIE